MRTFRDSQFLTLRSLSNVSGIPPRTLRRRINDGSHPLPAFRVGRRGKFLVSFSEFCLWIEKFRVRPGPSPRGKVCGEVSSGNG
jgi:hypothetical protein